MDTWHLVADMGKQQNRPRGQDELSIQTQISKKVLHLQQIQTHIYNIFFLVSGLLLIFATSKGVLNIGHAFFFDGNNSTAI